MRNAINLREFNEQCLHTDYYISGGSTGTPLRNHIHTLLPNTVDLALVPHHMAANGNTQYRANAIIAGTPENGN